ncbi:phage tail tape measure protein, partial [Streptomyces sp. NPDC006356]
GQMLKTGLAKNADEAFDILTAGFQSGANKADDLLDTFGEYGTQFRKFGLDGQTATGLLTQGLKAGARDADIVADSIKEFSIRAIDGSESTKAGFEAIGLSAGDMAAKIGKGGDSATAALDLTLDRLRGIKDPVEREAAAVALFGTQAEDLGQALYALDPSSAVAALGEVGGAADKMAKTVGDSPASALESFKRKSVEKLAEVSGTFIQFATDNSEVFEPLAYTLAGIAGTVLLIKGAMMVWTAAQAAWTAATTIATGAQWLWNSALFASPITWIVLAVIALIAVIVLIATKTTWFQDLWAWAWGGIKSAFDSTVEWLKGAMDWFAGLGDKFSGWWGAAKDAAVTKLGQMVDWVTGLPGRLWDALSGMGSSLYNTAWDSFQSMKTAVVNRAVSTVEWLRGLPGRLVGALSNSAWRFYNIGVDFVVGIWDGIKSAGGWLWDRVSGFADDYIIEPIKGFLDIGSPSKKAADEVGQWIPAGIAVGAEDNAGVLDKAMRGLVDPAVYRPAGPISTGLNPALGAAAALGGARGQQPVVLQINGSDRGFREWFQGMVRTQAGGDVIKFAEG